MAKANERPEQKVVRPKQDIVASIAEDFKKKLLGHVEQGVNELTIDLNRVKVIDSLGIGVLIATHNSINKNGGKLIITNVSADIFKLFKLMRLDRHFEIEPVPMDSAGMNEAN